MGMVAAAALMKRKEASVCRMPDLKLCEELLTQRHYTAGDQCHRMFPGVSYYCRWQMPVEINDSVRRKH